MFIRTSNGNRTVLVRVTKTGLSGREVELRSVDKTVQWRYVGQSDEAWVDLLDIGVILPTGGGTGQVLAKLSNLDYDYAWQSSSSADKNYVSTFTNQSSVSVQHNMNKFPSVTVVDTTGDEVDGEIEHTDMNNLVATFSSSFSGKIICN